MAPSKANLTTLPVAVLRCNCEFFVSSSAPDRRYYGPMTVYVEAVVAHRVAHNRRLLPWRGEYHRCRRRVPGWGLSREEPPLQPLPLIDRFAPKPGAQSPDDRQYRESRPRQ